MAHSWFQAVLATNESLYEYMDEGMTSYATELCMRHLLWDPVATNHRIRFVSITSAKHSAATKSVDYPRRPLPNQPCLRRGERIPKAKRCWRNWLP